MNLLKKLRTEEWHVAYRKKADTIINNSQFDVINNLARYWAADPFVIEYKNETYCFAELYDRFELKGKIGFCRLTQDGPTKWEVAIDEPYHISFPYIFEKHDELFIMPESSADNSLYLYKAIDFPKSWKKHAILRDNKRCVDSVFLDPDQCKYVLTSDENGLSFIDVNNPRNDKHLEIGKVNTIRNAGAISERKCIRVAQDCELQYGSGLIFYEYYFYNGRYKEKEILRIYPKDIVINKRINACGIHTYNSTENYEVIDIKSFKLNVFSLIARAIRRIKK